MSHRPDIVCGQMHDNRSCVPMRTLQLVPLSLVAVLLIGTAGCRQTVDETERTRELPRANSQLPAWRIRRHAQVMADALARADRVRVYGELPRDPESEASERTWVKVGEVSRAQDEQRWQRMVQAVRAAEKGKGVIATNIRLRLDLIESEQRIAVATFLPLDGAMALRIGGRDYGFVWAGSAIREVFQPYWDEVRRRLTEAFAPPSPGPATEPVERPPSPAGFHVVKERVVELFRNADYANIGKREWTKGVRGVEPQGKHRRAWQLMTDGLEEAEPGWPTRVWPPDVMIRPMVSDAPDWGEEPGFDLYYKAGILYSEEPVLGAGKSTLKPSDDFERGLQMLLNSLGREPPPKD